MKAHEEYEQMVNELETLSAENAKLIAERDELKHDHDSLRNYHDCAMVELGKECGEDFTEEPRFKWVRLAISEIVKQRDALLAERDMLQNNIEGDSDHIKSLEDAIEKLLAERAQWMKQEPVFYATKNLNIVITAETYNCGTAIGQADYPVPLYAKPHPLPAQQVPEWETEAKRAFWTGLEIGATFGAVSILPRWDEYIAKRKGELSAAPKPEDK